MEEFPDNKKIKTIEELEKEMDKKMKQIKETKKPRFTFDRKELMYGLIVIFLLFSMYYLGQLSTYYFTENVKTLIDKCPCAAVGTISPYGVQVLFNHTTPQVPLNVSGTMIG